MFWILFEAGLALGVLLFLVWWTMRSRRPEAPPAAEPLAPEPPAAP